MLLNKKSQRISSSSNIMHQHHHTCYAVRLGYNAASSPTLKSICGVANDLLLNQVSRNARHLLRVLLPLIRDTHYNLKSLQAQPIRCSALMDCNFINRMLHKELNIVSTDSCDQSGTLAQTTFITSRLTVYISYF